MTKALLTLVAITFSTITLTAQAPSAAPAGSTGLCKDGSYTNAASKSGACRGHKGVQTWYAAVAAPAAKPAAAPAPKPAPAPVAPAPMKAAVPAPAPTTVPAPATKAAPSSRALPAQAAPGGGPGLVWVNSESKVYHCQSDKYYGKTKNGKYLSEAAAKAEGDRPDAGKTCTK